MIRVFVKSEILAWAGLRSGIGRAELERRFPKILEWEGGETLPTIRQLEAYARATYTPFGYFFLADPPKDELPMPHYRTRANDRVLSPSPNLLDTVQAMAQRQDWYRDLVVEDGQDYLPLVGSAIASDEPGAVAKAMREALGLEPGWARMQRNWTEAFKHLRASAEEAGILVAVNSIVGNNTHRALDPGEFRGFVLSDRYAPLIFINGADSKGAQMFTLAHELAHVWINKSAAFDLRDMSPAVDATEQACDRIAAEFLVHDQELIGAWGSFGGEADPYGAAAKRFKVSELVIARRALDLRIITRDEFFRFYRSYQAADRRRRKAHDGPVDFNGLQAARLSKRFSTIIIRAARAGGILYSDAYRLTGLHGETFEKYAGALASKGDL